MLVPVEERIREASFAPVTEIVRSSASAVDAREKLDGAPTASMEIAPPSAVSIATPPEPVSISIPPAAPEALITIASAAVLFASMLILFATSKV